MSKYLCPFCGVTNIPNDDYCAKVCKHYERTNTFGTAVFEERKEVPPLPEEIDERTREILEHYDVSVEEYLQHKKGEEKVEKLPCSDPKPPGNPFPGITPYPGSGNGYFINQDMVPGQNCGDCVNWKISTAFGKFGCDVHPCCYQAKIAYPECADCKEFGKCAEVEAEIPSFGNIPEGVMNPSLCRLFTPSDLKGEEESVQSCKGCNNYYACPMVERCKAGFNPEHPNNPGAWAKSCSKYEKREG